jgi:hypothetical protein
VEASLLQLMEELLEWLERRDASDPDVPAWEATLRIRRLEDELTRRLRSVEALRLGVASAAFGHEVGSPDEVLAGIA